MLFCPGECHLLYFLRITAKTGRCPHGICRLTCSLRPCVLWTLDRSPFRFSRINSFRTDVASEVPVDTLSFVAWSYPSVPSHCQPLRSSSIWITSCSVEYIGHGPIAGIFALCVGQTRPLLSHFIILLSHAPLGFDEFCFLTPCVLSLAFTLES